MKTHITLASCALLLAFKAPALHAADAEVGIHIIEDVSGAELQKHGIKPADFEDMPVLGDVIFTARRTGVIAYDVIDDDGADNVPLHFFITPFEREIPTHKPFKGMTVREKMIALKEFEAKTATFRKENEEWRARVIDGAKTWFDECVEHRMKVEQAFLTRLKANRNHDFRRSDIIGAIHKANEILSESKHRFVIVNSDLDHKPGTKARDQEVRPLTAADLTTDTTIIVVNTSKEPDKSPLLRGLPNKILHADSLKEAAQIIAVQLGFEPAAPPPNSN